MVREISYIVPGEPEPKRRTRVNYRTHTVRKDKADRIYEPKVIDACAKAMQEADIVMISEKTPIEVNIRAYFKVPGSWSKANKAAADAGLIECTKRPDGDNIIKQIQDCMNELMYKDDSWVTRTSITKLYSTAPRVEVTVRWDDEYKFSHLIRK